MTLLWLPRNGASEILLLLAEHEAHAADMDRGDGAVAEFWDATETEQMERGCRIFHRHCARANFSGIEWGMLCRRPRRDGH